MAAHRYWRVYISVNQGGSNISLVEIEMRGTPGGLDLTGSGTAFASSQFNASNAPQYAFDNNTGTQWASLGNAPSWIAYDFGSGNDVEIVEVVGTARGGSAFNQSPMMGTIDYSDDGSTWTTSYGFVFQSNWTVSQTRILATPANSQYLSKEYGYAVVEVPYSVIHQIGMEVAYEPTLPTQSTRITQAGVNVVLVENGSSRISSAGISYIYDTSVPSRISMSGLSYVYSDYINFFGTPSMTNINSYSMVLSYKYKIYNVSGSLSSSDHVYLVDKDNETDILGSGIIKLYENSYITIIEKTGNWKNPNAKVIGSSGYGYLSPVEEWVIDIGTQVVSSLVKNWLDIKNLNPTQVSSELIGTSYPSKEAAINAIMGSHEEFTGDWIDWSLGTKRLDRTEWNYDLNYDPPYTYVTALSVGYVLTSMSYVKFQLETVLSNPAAYTFIEYHGTPIEDITTTEDAILLTASGTQFNSDDTPSEIEAQVTSICNSMDLTPITLDTNPLLGRMFPLYVIRKVSE